MNATTPMDNNDPFAVLGVSANASESEIRRQYLHLVKLNPPEQDAEKFRTIQRAYESARDPLVLAERLLNNSRNLTDCDAFTAMRHEWRNQSKQNRELTESIQQSVSELQRMGANFNDRLDAASDDPQIRHLLNIIIEMDISLQRAVDAMSDARTGTGSHQTARVVQGIQSKIQDHYHSQNFIKRWLVRTFYQHISGIVEQTDDEGANSTFEGMQILLTRLRKLMSEHHIQRTETHKRVFDANMMNAVSSVDSSEFAPGIVAEEISPAYSYQGQLIKFAEVRVARAPGENVTS